MVCLENETQRSLRLVLSETIYGHMIAQSTRLPHVQPSLLYDVRITFDMATMLWAREHIFSKRVDSLKPWVLHLRADSSPQYGRDFMISQCDIIQYGRDIHTTSIQKRLLPIQCIGSKAAGASQKLSKLVNSLALESEHAPQLATVNHFGVFLRTMVIHMVLLCVLFVQEFPLLVKSEVAFTAERVCSILTDFGTESQAWFTPGSVMQTWPLLEMQIFFLDSACHSLMLIILSTMSPVPPKKENKLVD